MKTGGKRVLAVALASVAATLTAVAGTAPRAMGDVGPQAAERAALRALDATGKRPARRVVFRSPRLLAAGGAVHVARLRGGGRADATGATTGRMPVALRAPRDERAWLFYEDRAPGTLFEHGGRVALVGQRSGDVRVSAVIQGPPAVGGELPRFLRSFAGYYAPYYRRAAATTLAEAARSPLATAAARRDAAQRLAADRACLVGTADTLGNFYDYAAVDHSRAAVGRLARELRELAPGVVATRYRRVSGTTLAGYLQGLVDTRGCREVSLYLAGGGYRAGGETAVALGVLTRTGGRIQRQLVTAAELRALLRSRPGVWWNLTVDAPHAGALLATLRGEPNLASLQASGRAGDASHIAGRPGTRSQGSLLFTRGLLDGLRSTLADQATVTKAAADQAGGRAPTFLSALLARSFDAGIDSRSFRGLGVRPQTFTRVGPTGPGGAPVGGTPGGAIPIDEDPRKSVNQPPAVAPSVSETDYPENDPATEIDSGLTVTDADSPTLTGATVRIASGHVPGEDELDLPAAGAVAGSWDAAAGVLTLTGTASVADYQAALRAVTYRNASDDPAAGPRQVTFRVTDGEAESAPASVAVDVAGANDTPEVGLAAGAAAYVEDAAAVAIDPAATVTDPDSAELTEAVVEISAGLRSGEDELELTAPVSGIAASYDAPTGTLTLTGPAPRADYEQALRNVAYLNDSDDPDTGTRTLSFEVTDGDGATSAAATRDVTVEAVNDAPVVTAGPSELDYAEDDPATAIDPALTVADVDSGQLESATVTVASGYAEGDDVLAFSDTASITGSWNAASGVLTLTGSASVADYQAALRAVTYRNASNDPAVGPRSIAFRADDGDDESAAATQTVDVAGDNDAPDLDLPADGDLAYTENDPATAIDAGAALTDPDSPTFASATARITAGFAADQDRLALTSAVDGITASYNDGTGVLTLSGPASRADFQQALRNVGYRNDSDDPDTTTRTVELQATDGGGADTPARARDVAVTAVNDAPTVATTATPPVAYDENDPPTTLDGDVAIADADSPTLTGATVQLTGGYVEGEDELSAPAPVEIAIAWDGTTGTLTLSGTATVAEYQATLRTVTYGNASDDPAAGTRTVTVRVDDGDDLSAAATRSVEVSPANDAPDVTLSGGSASYTENDPATVVDGGLTVVEPDSDAITGATVKIDTGLQTAEDRLSLTEPADDITANYDQPTGTLTLSGSATPAEYQAALRDVGYANTSEDPDTGLREVELQLTDGDGATGPVRTRNLAVTATNDTPVAADDDIGSTDEATVLTVAAPGALDNDDDVDSDTLNVVAVQGQGANVGVATTTAKGASVTVDASGAISYDPSGSATLRALGEGDTDTDTFTYAAGDGSANDTATVTVTVIGLPDPPEASNDSYDGVGNTTLTVGVAGPSGEPFKQLSGSVLDNDSDPDTDHSLLTVEAETVATTLGGSVTIEADGNFTYTPPAGSTSTDTFAYTVSDGERTDDGTVSIPLSGSVWYVDNQEAAGGLGRSGDPFDTLAEAVSASSAGDTLYVFRGSGTTTGMNAGAVLKANQRLLGETTTLTIGGDTLYTGVPANRPAIGNGGGAGVTLASGSRVEGLQVTAAGGAAIAGGTAAGSTVANTIANGSAGGVSLSGTSGTFTLSDLSVTTSGGTGVAASNAGTVQFTPTGTISIVSSGGKALDVSGSALGGTIDSVSVPSSTAGGVSLQTTTGSLTFGDLALTTTGGTGFYASGAAGLSVPAASTATVSSTGGPAIDVRSSSSPDVVFDSASSTNSSGTGFNVESITGGTVSVAAGTISGASGAAIRANGGTGTVTYAGTVNDGNGRPADVTGRTGGSVTISGNISEDDTGINVSGNSGGTTTFSGGTKTLSTGTNDAVFLNNNAGHTVSFTGGGLALTATSGRGFVATGGGTVDVQGSNNTISNTTGTALEVQNTGIGAADLTFRSIASNGGANGIYLNNTTGAGGLTVTGSGTAESGGVIQSTSGADGSTAGVGAYLNSTRDVSLARMRFANHQGHAIRGNSVNGLSLTDSTVNGVNGTNDANDEGSIWLNNMTGTVALTDTDVSGGYEDNIDVFASSGAMTLNLTRIDVGANSLNLGGNGLLVRTSGTANVTTTVSDSDFTSSREDLLQHIVTDTSTSNFTIANSRFSNNHANYLGGSAALLETSGNGSGADLTYRIDGNTARDTGGGFFVMKGTGIANARGRISNNVVGVSGVPLSGAKVGSGITVEARGQGTHTTAVTNNQVRQYNQTAYRMIAGEQSVADNGVVTFNVTATGNLQAEPGASATAGWRMELADPNTGPTVCFDLNANTLTGGGSIADVRIQNQMDTSIYRMPGYTGGLHDTTAVANYIAGRNTTGGAGEISIAANTNNSGFNNTVPAGSLCPQPPA